MDFIRLDAGVGRIISDQMSQSEDWHRLWERLGLRLPREPLEGVLSFQVLARPRFLLDEPNCPGLLLTQ